MMSKPSHLYQIIEANRMYHPYTVSTALAEKCVKFSFECTVHNLNLLLTYLDTHA